MLGAECDRSPSHHYFAFLVFYSRLTQHLHQHAPPNTMPILSKSSIQYRHTWNIQPETQVAQGSSLMISLISLCFHISCLLLDAICMMIHDHFIVLPSCLHHVVVIPHISFTSESCAADTSTFAINSWGKRYEKDGT